MREIILNCTQHVINIIKSDRNVAFESCGIIPRVSTVEVEVDTQEIEDFFVPVVTSDPGIVTNLPDFSQFRENENTKIKCIVSRMVLDALDWNSFAKMNVFFVAPDTGATAIRNEKGHVIGVTRLVTK